MELATPRPLCPNVSAAVPPVRRSLSVLTPHLLSALNLGTLALNAFSLLLSCLTFLLVPPPIPEPSETALPATLTVIPCSFPLMLPAIFSVDAQMTFLVSENSILIPRSALVNVFVALAMHWRALCKCAWQCR